MAYEKVTYFKIACEGPCGSSPIRVSQVPSDWRRIKVHIPHAPNGARAIEKEILLCPKCNSFAVDLLCINGFTFRTLANVLEKEG